MRILIIVLISFSAVSPVMADLTWGYAGDLTGVPIRGAGVAQAGMLVQMYWDPAGDSELNEIWTFKSDGTPTDYYNEGGYGLNDDVLLSFTTALVSGKGGVFFGDSIPAASWSSLYGEDVYTVIFTGTSIATSSFGTVLDPTPFTLPYSDPGNYVISPIPEPSTIGLMGMAGMAIFLSRNKSQKPRLNNSMCSRGRRL